MSAPRVLIVDDDVALLEALPEALRLRMDGVIVDTCDSGSAALDRIAATDYDAIISDIKMPGIDGLALLAKIRVLRPDTPTLLITGHGEHDLAVQALRGGAYDFIKKPIDREYFVASLSRAVQMRQLTRQVKELDQLKAQFFTDVSHELRAPLALVLGPTRKLLANGELSVEQRHDLEVIDRNARTLLKRVNDLLDIAKLEAGKVGVNRAEVDLAQLLRLTAAHFEAFAQERQISFSVEAPPSVPAQADSEKLQRVFLNLLSNALKFAPDRGRVRCVLRVEGDRAIVAFEDNGPGVPVDLREAVFERFHQGESGSAGPLGGTGLGLAITKEFVALHGGTIAVTDAPEGGALFSVVLPLVAPPASVAPTTATGRDVDAIARETLEELRQNRATGIDPTREHAGLPREVQKALPLPEALVLVVEDNPDMNRFIAETLASEYRVATAFDGREGLEKAQALPPDLILTDVMMPRMRGDELLSELRAHTELATVPVVVLTAKADNDLRVKLLRAGAQDFLTKPFSAEELRARVANQVTLKRARDVLQQELASRTHDVGALAREVTDRQRQLQTTLATLRVSEERSRSLVESVKDYAILMLDRDGHVVNWNVGAERMTGYTAPEIVRQHVSRLYPGEDIQRETPAQELSRAAAEGRFEAEGWRVRKDGSRFWANAILTPLRDDLGLLWGFSNVTRDITERKRAEEQIATSLKEKEVLLKELHHRVKNNLQVICSLLNLQSESIHDRRVLELLAASQNRVRSMALIHEQLYQSPNLATIDFAEYIRRLALNLFRSYGADADTVSMALNLEEVVMGIDTAVPCGLIINELISNSLKHAFPPGREGEIRVDLRSRPDNTCELVVSDTGIGLPPASNLDTRPASGLQLVATLTDQLGGTLESQTSEGARFRIEFPR